VPDRLRFAAVVGGLAVLAVVMVGVARVTGRGGPDAHPLGTEVLVGHVDSSGGDPGVRTQIGLTVLRVRKGTQRELASNGLEIDSEDRDSTPFYVDARFANKGGNAVKRNLDVGLDDTDGNLVPPTIIFSFGDSTFGPCPSVTEGMLEPGQSYESCTLVLVPAGLEVGRVHFLSDKGPGRGYEFVYWEIE
jgi:hypothetical protein